MKILVIIPAYNEEKSIAAVISQVRERLSAADLIVINDGSLDSTSAVAKRHGATVIDLPFNLGIGGAMQTGYKYALENGYDCAVQIDGDGQHLPSEAHKLIQVLHYQNVDLVIGSRFIQDTGYKISPMRRLGKTIFSSILAFFIGKRIYDPTSGFRAVNGSLIKQFSMHYPQDYPEVESILLAKRMGFKIGEVSVNINPRGHGISSITAFRAVYYMIKVVLGLSIMMFKVRRSHGY